MNEPHVLTDAREKESGSVNLHSIQPHFSCFVRDCEEVGNEEQEQFWSPPRWLRSACSTDNFESSGEYSTLLVIIWHSSLDLLAL